MGRDIETMLEQTPYDPLDYDNLAKNVVHELMNRGPYHLPLREEFSGAGVYALFYNGDFAPYAMIRSPGADRPIYVGKAVPSGARKGRIRNATVQEKALNNRISEHVRSIQEAKNLRCEDLVCRFLVLIPLWITLAERFLIEHYRPIWNTCIDGFGLHDPGKGRYEGEISWWDALHPGRSWSGRLKQTKTSEMALERLRQCLEGQGQRVQVENIVSVDEAPIQTND